MNTDPFYSESNRQALQENIQQAKEGKVVVKPMEELEQMADEQSAVCQRRGEYDRRANT